MNIRKILFYLPLIILCSQCSSSKNIQFEDGKCFAKCIIPDDIFVNYDEYAEFTGNVNEEDVELEVIEIVIQEKSTKWVKKKADRNCLSADPNDCLVWCLEDIPEKKEIFTILKDTTQSDNYVLKRIEKNVIREKRGYTEWKQVICEKDVTKLIIGQIQGALKEKGYFDKIINHKLDSKTRSAITDFQKENYLPIGQLDFETLDVLGVVLN